MPPLGALLEVWEALVTADMFISLRMSILEQLDGDAAMKDEGNADTACYRVSY